MSPPQSAFRSAFVRTAAGLLVLVILCSCGGRRPAELPRGYAQIATETQISRAEQAAQEAAQNARVVQAQYERLARELQELKSELARVQVMGRACGDLAATAEKKARANRAAAAKKAAEAAALAAAQPAVQRSPTTGLPIPEYSKSDAPQGYAPPVATPPAAPTHAAH